MNKAVLISIPAGQTYADVPDPDADVFEAAVTNIEAARVRRLIRQLPEIERRVIRFRYGIQADQLSVREIARRLGTSPKTVTRISDRAMSRLRILSGAGEPAREAAGL